MEKKKMRKGNAVAAGSIAGKKKGKSILSNWQLYVMVLPAIIYFILFHYKPMYGIVLAFKKFNMREGIMGSPWVGLENFERLFSSYWFPIILKNTLTVSVLSLVLGFPLPIIMALMINEIKNRRIRETFQTVTYAPHFISIVVLCGMISIFLSPSTGIINRIIELFGGDAIAFMQEPSWFKWVYVLSGIWQSTGWGTIIYTAALAGVDKSLLEAAEVDGATRFQRMIYINLPVLIPTMVTLFILNCGRILGVGYEKVYLLQTATNISASEVISTYVYKMGLVNNDFSFSTAVGLFNSVINSIILISANKLSKKFSHNSLW